MVETSGLEISSIAKRLNVSESTVEGWTTRRQKISVSKLENLSEYVKRPLATFLLDSPPDEQMLPDYRGQSSKITQKTALAIRMARYLQEAAGEMMRLLGEDAAPDIHATVTVHQSPEKVASEERLRLGLEERELVYRPGEKAQRFYNALREAVEAQNIPVFQQSTSTEEMRGMSLYGRPCVVLINSKDIMQARRFTLMHEYGHILLREGGLCKPGMRNKDDTYATHNVEAWCNRFAAFALMPRTQFLEEHQKLKESGKSYAETIDRLARKFVVSKQATAIHALDLGLESRDFRSEGKKGKSGGRRPDPVTACVNERGGKLVSLVLASRQARLISGRDAVDYLGIDLKHIAKLRERLSQT